MPPSELNQLVEDCAPRLLFVGREDEGVARELAVPSLALDGDYETLLDAAPARSLRARWPADGIWYLIYTSGTTGRPKGVIYNFRMALANHVNIGSAIDIRSTDTTLTFLPPFHSAGINLHSLPTLFAGGRVVIPEGFESSEWLMVGKAGVST